MAITFDKWVSTYLGKAIDYDGVSGVQCVDLAKHYAKNVLGITPQSIGNAIEYYNKRTSSSYLKNNFTWIDNTASFIPQKGDVAVFKTKSGYGHVCICTGEGTTSYFYSYDQNWGSKGEGMTKTKHTYSGTSTLLGVLRPKNQANIAAASTATSTSSTVYYTVKTNGGNLNCRKTASTNGTILGVFKNGTKLIYKNKKSGSWYYVSGTAATGKTITGYCHKDYLKAV